MELWLKLEYDYTSVACGVTAEITNLEYLQAWPVCTWLGCPQPLRAWDLNH